MAAQTLFEKFGTTTWFRRNRMEPRCSISTAIWCRSHLAAGLPEGLTVAGRLHADPPPHWRFPTTMSRRPTAASPLPIGERQTNSNAG